MKKICGSILLALALLAAQAPGPAIADDAAGSIGTEVLMFDRKALALHVAQMVDGRDNLPFMKWDLTGTAPLRYFVLGLKEPYLSVFDAVMAKLGERLKVRVERSPAPPGSQMLFFYVNDLTDLLASANLTQFFGGKEARQQESFKNHIINDRPKRISGYGAKISDENNMVPSFFRLARALSGFTQPNEFVQAFAIDIYMAFTLRDKAITDVPTSLYAHLGDIAKLAPSGAPYAWRLPPVDLLYLDALYKPDVEPGMLDHEAATTIHKLIQEDLAAERVLKPVSRVNP